MPQRILRGLAASDRLAGGLARLATTWGQLALVALGTHLAADTLDDAFAAGLALLQQQADAHLSGPLGGLAEALGYPYVTFFLWDSLPTAAVAAWAALSVELTTTALLCGAFILTPRQAPLSWAAWRQARCIHALLLPPALLGVVLAGSWSLAMAAEDLLPPSPIAAWAAGALGIATLLRFGLPALARAIAALDPEPPWRRGLLAAPFLSTIGGLAWLHGVPVWGWLP